jgi:hypothetical protein
VRREVIETTITLAVTAFGLVAALAWNTAIQGLFEAIFGEAGSVAAQFFYAIVVTVVVVFATIRLARLKERVAPTEEPPAGERVPA